MKRFIALAAAAALVAVAGCARKEAARPAQRAAAARPSLAPDSFQVRFETSRGPFTVEVTRSLSPLGADRFYALVTTGYFTGVRFFRVVPGFVVQFGMNGDPRLNAMWADRKIPDEPVKETNAKGTIVFATSGPNTRSNQLFINLADNPRLDGMGFTPFGRVVDGMNVVESIYSGYGESPDQDQITASGNAYLERMFPKLDYIKSATVVSGAAAVH